MDLKSLGASGERVAVVLEERMAGRQYFSAAVGTIHVTADGHAYIKIGKNEFEAWEIQAGARLDTPLGAALAKAAETDSMASADLAARVALTDVGELPGYDIFQGIWRETAFERGFKNECGVFLVDAASNMAYGNYRGGFTDPDAARDFSKAHSLDGAWRVTDTRPTFDEEPEVEDIVVAPRMFA